MESELVKRKMAQYLLLKSDIEELKVRQERIKEELDPYLRAAPTNARGSYVVEFDEPLQIGDKRYKSLQKVRKESKVLNEERVTEWLYARVNSESEEDIHWDDLVSNSGIFKTVQYIDQDVLWDFFVQDYITEEELNSFFDITHSYAFSPTKE